jgi:hypothetical protein
MEPIQMADVNVEVEAPAEEESPDVVVVETGNDDSVDAVVVEETIDLAARVAVLEERCGAFVTRDDLTYVAESINNTRDRVEEVAEEVAEEHLEEVAEAIEESKEPEPEKVESDEPPESKRHAWWKTIGS